MEISFQLMDCVYYIQPTLRVNGAVNTASLKSLQDHFSMLCHYFHPYLYSVKASWHTNGKQVLYSC